MTSTPAPTPALPSPGDLIAGKYQIEKVLGAGGMGVVVAARHIALRQRVAIKFLLPAAMRLPEASARFLREAQAAAAVQSEHVARVLDVGRLENGAPYMVMEHLSGKDLSALLKQRGPFPLGETVDFVLQAGEAIAEAHTLGIIHRDLKPANLFLTTRPDGSALVKVLDFGLSKMDEEAVSGASLTASGIVVGSPHYMSPEQLRSLKKVDPRTDIWALGVILYELVTGRRPFDGPSLTAVCISIATDAPIAMLAVRPDLPEAFGAVVHACLEKEVDRRTPSVAALAHGLAAFATRQSTPSLERIARFAGRAAPIRLSEEDIEVISGEDWPVAPAHPPRGVPPEPSLGVPVPVVTNAPLIAPPLVFAGANAPNGRTLSAGADTPDVTTLHSNAWGQTKPIRLHQPRLWFGLGVVIVLVAAGAVMWMSLDLGHANTTFSHSPAVAPSAAPKPSAPEATTPAPAFVSATSSMASATPVDVPAATTGSPAGTWPDPVPKSPPLEVKPGAASSPPLPGKRAKAGSSPLDRFD